MKKILSFIVKIWNQILTLLKIKKMIDIDFEKRCQYILESNLTPFIVCNTIKTSLYKNGAINELKIEITFTSNNPMILILDFTSKKIRSELQLNVNYDLLELHNNVDSICKLMNASYKELYQAYSEHLK